MKLKYTILKFSKLIFILNFILIIINIKSFKILKIGVIGVRHEVNIGNNLIKFAMHIILTELGFKPYIIGTHWNNYNISFINKTTNLIIIKNNFSEIKKNEYDVLMVNSDQTWRKFDDYFYDYGFLNFAKEWKIRKFVYGASLGFDYWALNSSDEKIIKILLKNFKGISIREKGSIQLIRKHLNIRPVHVIDPTLLIDKKYYLNIIKNYSKNLNESDNYIFSYRIAEEKDLENFINNSSKTLNYKIYNFPLDNETTVEEFLYRAFKCKAVITNSYHGVIFSIIFQKPFIAFHIYKYGAKERLNSLGKLLGFEERIFEYNEQPQISLLTTPLNINNKVINSLKKKSITYYLWTF